MVDGVGRVAHMGAPEHAKEAAKAFGVGALSQGLVTYAMGVPALWMLGSQLGPWAWGPQSPSPCFGQERNGPGEKR